MNKKTKGTITSIFGVVFLVISVGMIVANNFLKDYSFSWTAIVPLIGLGYVFLVADDELIKKILFKKLGK